MQKQRKKPRLFSFSREVELAGFTEVVTDPDDRAALEAVVDSFAAICTRHAVDAETLMPIARAARHRSPYVRGAAITRLAVLCHYFDDAHPVMEQVCRDADEDVRLYATAALANTPEAVGLPLLERCLGDESFRVRKAAAQAGSAIAWPELLPILARQLKEEADARVRVLLELAIDFQRQAARAAPPEPP